MYAYFECRTTGTMDNWYHAIFDIGGQLGPSSYVKVDNWYHQVFLGWTTGTMPFLTWVDNWDHLLYYLCTGDIYVLDFKLIKLCSQTDLVNY